MFDTERIGRDGWHKAAEILHIDLPEGIIAAMRGTGTDRCREIFNAAIPGSLYDTAHDLRLRYADEVIAANGVPVKPGAAGTAAPTESIGHPGSAGNVHPARKRRWLTCSKRMSSGTSRRRCSARRSRDPSPRPTSFWRQRRLSTPNPRTASCWRTAQTVCKRRKRQAARPLSAGPDPPPRQKANIFGTTVQKTCARCSKFC